MEDGQKRLVKKEHLDMKMGLILVVSSHGNIEIYFDRNDNFKDKMNFEDVLWPLSLTLISTKLSFFLSVTLILGELTFWQAWMEFLTKFVIILTICGLSIFIMILSIYSWNLSKDHYLYSSFGTQGLRVLIDKLDWGIKMNLKPLHDRVLVERVSSEDKTKGGIIIPDTAQEKPMEGKVLAVGNGARNENGQVVALDVKKGDRILFGKWSGTEVKIDGKELLIMKESDIMGIIEK